MAFSVIQSASNSEDGSDTNVTVSLTGVTAGSLVVVLVGFEGGGATTCSVSDGTDTFQACTQFNHSNGDNNCQIHFLLSSTSGNKTYTATFGAARAFKRIHVYEVSYSGSVTLVTERGQQDATAGTAVSSGNLRLDTSESIVFAIAKEYAVTTFSSPLVNGAAADGSIINSPVDSHTATWHERVTSPFSSGAASITSSASMDWLCAAAAFREGAAPGHARPMPLCRMCVPSH